MRKIHWLRSVPFILFHLAVLSVFLVPFSWKLVAVCLASYLVRMFGITAGYHRYFSHRSFKTGRVGQFALAFLGGMSLQKGALWWASNHRDHHRTSDTEQDIHSPKVQGFLWSHFLWFLATDYDETHWDRIEDLSRFPELRWINKYHWIPGTFLGAVLLVFGGLPVFIWGFIVATVLLWHGTFTINSLAHVFGSRRYETGDHSANNFWLALITLGEGWHNNHHCYMSSARQGFFWWEIDLTYYALKVFERFGLLSNLREPPLQLLESKRI
jgi:stearoyl-CoA desaturase (delta-9 desaturase)